MEIEVPESNQPHSLNSTKQFVWEIQESAELEELLKSVLLVGKNQTVTIETFCGNHNLFVSSTLRRIERNYYLTYPLEALTQFDALHDWMFKYLDVVQRFQHHVAGLDWNCSYN